MRSSNLIMLLSLAVVAATALPALADVGLMDAHTKEHFPMADANEDGQLSLGEFKNFVDLQAEDDVGGSRRIKRLGLHERAFSRVDANDDGAVTLVEIAKLQARRRH